MDEWWNQVTQWWASQNWGSVPDWFAAIGTVGALFLGLIILMRERASSRRAEADSFVTWWVVVHNEKEDEFDQHYGVVVHAYNAGTRPVPVAAINSNPLEGDAVNEFMRKGSSQEIRPQEKVEKVVTTSDKPDLARMFIGFSDGNGRTWIRCLYDNKYYTQRQAERRMKSKKRFKQPFTQVK